MATNSAMFDGLGDVAVEPGGQESLAVSLHRLCGQGEHRQGCGAAVRPQAAERRDAIDVRQLDVHEHEIGRMLDGKRDRLLPGGRLQGAVALREQDVTKQLHVLAVVLHDEDLRARRHARSPPPAA